MKKKILVLGGGFGGAAAARKTRKLLGTEHSVTLVDRDRRTYLCGSFPMLIAGQKNSKKVSRSLYNAEHDWMMIRSGLIFSVPVRLNP